jgi:chromosome segregation ATPase
MRRMIVRDDEDLAVDQLRAAGREDDAGLAAHRAGAGPVEQEAGARRAERIEPAPSLKRLMDLREQISRLQLTLGALPTKSLARFDELDAKARDLGAKRSEHEDRLAALDQPASRFRRRDPDAEERTFLQTAIEMDTGALADLAVDRARLQRELGDPDQVRSERDGIENALSELRCDHDCVQDVLVQRDIERELSWLTGPLGDRPDGSRQRETWDQAARVVAGFRLDHDVIDHDAPLGPEPRSDGGGHRYEWAQAQAALERAQRLLGREPADHDHGVDIGIG